MTDGSPRPPATAAPRAASESPPRRARPRIRVPGPFAVLAGSLGAFFAALGVLALQDRGAASDVSAQPLAIAPRQVVVRRVVLTRIVIHERPRGRRTRTTTSAAPAPAPPAPAAPAPAPVTTRSS
jgi:hypothetical protein